MVSQLFDVVRQLTFYGAYHSNKTNVLIHMICVPILLWTFQVLTSEFPLPSFIPPLYHEFSRCLIFELKFPAIMAVLYISYYLLLEPVAAVLYIPQFTLSLLTATAFSYHQRNSMVWAGILYALSWAAQFIGHGFAEKRAPALIDNALGAVVLAPFFVHLEILFYFGYNPKLHKRIQNGVGLEIARIRREDAEKKRVEEKKEM